MFPISQLYMPVSIEPFCCYHWRSDYFFEWSLIVYLIVMKLIGGTIVWDWRNIVGRGDHSEKACGMCSIFCSVLSHSQVTLIIVLFGRHLFVKLLLDKLMGCLGSVVLKISSLQMVCWSIYSVCLFYLRFAIPVESPIYNIPSTFG